MKAKIVLLTALFCLACLDGQAKPDTTVINGKIIVSTIDTSIRTEGNRVIVEEKISQSSTQHTLLDSLTVSPDAMWAYALLTDAEKKQLSNEGRVRFPNSEIGIQPAWFLFIGASIKKTEIELEKKEGMIVLARVTVISEYIDFWWSVLYHALGACLLGLIVGIGAGDGANKKKINKRTFWSVGIFSLIFLLIPGVSWGAKVMMIGATAVSGGGVILFALLINFLVGRRAKKRSEQNSKFKDASDSKSKN